MNRRTMPTPINDSCRRALLFVLWHHQGWHSAIGIPLRTMLGFGRDERMTVAEVEECKALRLFLEGKQAAPTSIGPFDDDAYSKLAPYQQRVVHEKAELQERLVKLFAFFQTASFRALSEAERSRLRNQARWMDGYAAVLEERMAEVNVAFDEFKKERGLV